MDWITFAWLNRGKRRQEILFLISDAKSPITIKEIKTICHISISQISVIISDLYKKELIICKNPEDKIGRLYEISQKGQSMVSELRKD